MIIRYDPDIGFLYVPHLKARIPNELGGYYFRTNSLGFRSDIEYRTERDDRPRILFFGDSYTAGDGCSNHERFSELVGSALGAEVFNYGLSGSGTDQQLLIFERFAKSVEADLIVLCVNVENIERIQSPHRESIDRVTGKRVLVPKPYFTLDNGNQLRLNNVPVPLERQVVDDPPRDSRTRARWLGRCIRLYRAARPVSREGEYSHDWLQKLRGCFLRWSRFQPYSGYTSEHHYAWKLMRAIVERFHSSVSSIPLLVVPLPTYYYYLHGVKPLYRELFNNLAVPERGLHVSDLGDRIIVLPEDTRRRLSFRHDSHFSPFGHEQVANFLKEEIVARGLLPSTGRLKSVKGSVRATPVKKSTYILGVSGFYHDSAAALVKDGTIVAAAEEERFTRVKNDRRFPQHAVNYCLEEAEINQDDLSAVVYYDNASLTFERIMHNLLALSPDGEEAWLRILPSWVQYKLHLPQLIRRRLCYDGLVLQDIHHRSHAASAFYPSPFKRAALLTIDGVGEWGTASIGLGSDGRIQLLKQMCFPHSLGLLYSAFTQFTGFKVNDGEYKMMGLAPYGEPKYVRTILEHLVDVKDDGSLMLNLEYFAFLSGSTMTSHKFAELFGGPAREQESRITQREMDLARSIQVVTEETILRMAKHARKLTGEPHLCLAGGVALNCVANGRLLREGPFESLWIQPAAGDAGGALGAALDAYYHYFEHPHEPPLHKPSQRGSYLGPEFTQEEIRAFLQTHGYPYEEVESSHRARTLAALLDEGKVVGHFSGRSEFGPRALGARSILGDARNIDMQVNLNLKIKYWESFRPFAPTVLADKAKEYFKLDGESPYMLIVAPVIESRRKRSEDCASGDDLLQIVRQQRSDIPAVTHVDYSARIQTIREEDHPAYYDLIKHFEERTGCAVVVNTSFNVRGEPIVCTPYDAYRCFMRTDMDVLMLGNCLLTKSGQPNWPETKGHLEKKDAAVRMKFPMGLIRGLRRIYAKEFVPASIALGERRVDRIFSPINERSSTWENPNIDQSPKAIFSIPGAMDSAVPNAEIMARALTESWVAGPVTEALRPVLVSLVKLGHRYQATELQDEDVSDSVYVMF